MVPNEFHTLFWDTNFADFDPRAYPDYTILRVLEYGDTAAFEWLRKAFSDNEIRRVLRTEHRLSPKSATFWALVYDVPTDQIAALRETSSPITALHE